MDKRQEQAIGKWTELVLKKEDEIDPDQTHDWEDLAIGFFLALEFSIHEVRDMVVAVWWNKAIPYLLEGINK